MIEKIKKDNPWKKENYKGGSIIVDTHLKNNSENKEYSSIKNILKTELEKKIGSDSYYDSDTYLDSPINGDFFNARLILLFNNPNLEEELLKNGKNIDLRNITERIRKNLTLTAGPADMLYANTDDKDEDSLLNKGYKWYKTIWKNEIFGETEEIQLKKFQENVCILEWFPYPTSNFGELKTKNELIKKLETHKFIVALAKYAIRSGKTVIAMRSTTEWEEALLDGEDEDLAYLNLFYKNFYLNLKPGSQGLDSKNIVRPLKGKDKLKFTDILK